MHRSPLNSDVVWEFSFASSILCSIDLQSLRINNYKQTFVKTKLLKLLKLRNKNCKESNWNAQLFIKQSSVLALYLTQVELLQHITWVQITIVTCFITMFSLTDSSGSFQVFELTLSLQPFLSSSHYCWIILCLPIYSTVT